MSSINLDGGVGDQLAIVGAQIAQKSTKTVASVVAQAEEATAQIQAQGAVKADAGPAAGKAVDTSI
jgi:hypothetical protein